MKKFNARNHRVRNEIVYDVDHAPPQVWAITTINEIVMNFKEIFGIGECFRDAENVNVVVIEKVSKFILFIVNGAGIPVQDY